MPWQIISCIKKKSTSLNEKSGKIKHGRAVIKHMAPMKQVQRVQQKPQPKPKVEEPLEPESQVPEQQPEQPPEEYQEPTMEESGDQSMQMGGIQESGYTPEMIEMLKQKPSDQMTPEELGLVKYGGKCKIVSLDDII